MKEKNYNVNSYYEGLVQNLYGGAKGCFSAFMHFFYQYNQCFVFAEEYSGSFKQLYEIELKNCEILSFLLIKMGGDNKYYSSTRKYISTYNVGYIKDLGKIFLMDIEILEIHTLELKNVIQKVDNQELKNKLKIVLENKKNQLKILKENYFKNNLIN